MLGEIGVEPRNTRNTRKGRPRFSISVFSEYSMVVMSSVVVPAFEVIGLRLRLAGH
jgi:hypothetical protein